MKKLIIFLLLLVGGGTFAFGAQQIPMHIIDQNPSGSGYPLAPIRPWYICEDSYVLSIPTFDDDCSLELLDENGNTVFSTTLFAGITTVTLPSTLSGSFELCLIPFSSTYYYRGYLEL